MRTRLLSASPLLVLCAAIAALPAQAPATGRVIVSVTPEAELFVGTRRIGPVTAQTLTLAAGRYVFTFNHPDYKPLRRTVDVKADLAVTLTIDLAEKAVRLPPSTAAPPAPSPERTAAGEATLTVRLEPRALLRIDGRAIGEVTSHTETVSPGRHVVLIEHPDYQPLQRYVSVDAGGGTTIEINLAEKGRRRK